MRDSFLEFGNKFATAIGEKLDERSQEPEYAEEEYEEYENELEEEEKDENFNGARARDWTSSPK